MTRVTVKVVGRPYLLSAMDAVAAKTAATVRKQIATAMRVTREGTMTMQDSEGRTPKVHLFHDHSEERAKGQNWMKDIYCRGNSGNAITNNPKNVTCLRCLRRMKDTAKLNPGGFSLQDIRGLEEKLEAWEEDANRLADVIGLVLKSIEERVLHIIVVPGTQITLDQVVRGAMALHVSNVEKQEGVD